MPYLGTPPQSGFISQEANQYFTGLTQNYIDLNQSISSLSSVIVLVNGVVQENSDLTLTSSSRITLGATLVSADKVTCIYVAKISSTQAPATGSVTSDMLSGSIANSKLANSSVSINGSTLALGGSLTGIGDDNAPSFSAYIGTMNNVANSTETVITATTEVFDSNSKYDTSNYRFTPGVIGKYFFRVSFKNNQTSARLQCGILKNGSLLSEAHGRIEVENNGHGSNTYTGVVGSGIAICDNVNDYFQGFVWQKSGSTETVYNSQFMGFRLAGIS